MCIKRNIEKGKFIQTLFLLVFLLSINPNSFSQTKIINSGWQFSSDKNSENWETINIPHTWNLKDAFDDEPGYRRGMGYYRKKIYLDSAEIEKIHYLKFNAVNQETTVIVNGKEVGNHKGGYTAFNFNITDYLLFNDYNLIEVTVDNSHNLNIPPLDADFTFYGGIYRDVELVSLPKQHISKEDYASDGFYVNYNKVTENEAQIELTTLIQNFGNSNQELVLKVTLSDSNGNKVVDIDKKLKLKESSSEKSILKLPVIKNPNLWSPKSPYLYKLLIELRKKSELLDSRETNVAFRWTEIDPEKGFFLNGKPLKLIGVNRHQDYEGFGNAVPIALQAKDIHIIKEMGANIIRFAHYPHARKLYKLCDELGILVWTEIPVVNKVTNSPEFFETSLDMQKEHIKQYYNYPSVVMFGYMNEIFLRLAFDNKSTDAEKEDIKSSSVKLAQQLEDLTRELAPNHITVMALHFNELYNETGIADIPMLIGWNLYFGWYHDRIMDLGKFLDDQHSRYPERPIMVSEYGPGADMRIFTPTPKKYDYSLEYQLQLHKGYYEQVNEREFTLGMTAWNYADFGSEFRADAIPHVNQKGLLQYNRTPKEVYYWYKSVLRNDIPFIHIASEFYEGLTLFAEDSYKIKMFSNQKALNVELNGKNIGEFKVENGVCTVPIKFKHGKNVLKAMSDKAHDESQLMNRRISKLDFKDFSRFGINVGSHFYFTDEENLITWVPDRKYQSSLFGYVNGEVFNVNKENHQGIPYNIRNTDSDPLYQTMLMGCTEYKVDIADGNYKVDLFFVEPQIKPNEDIYKLASNENDSEPQKKRIFDIKVNGKLLRNNFNLAKEYPEKYGVRISGIIKAENNQGLKIQLVPIEGEPILSGVLIEKMD